MWLRVSKKNLSLIYALLKCVFLINKKSDLVVIKTCHLNFFLHLHGFLKKTKISQNYPFKKFSNFLMLNDSKMTTLFNLLRLRSFLLFAAIVGTFSPLAAQDDQQVTVQTEKIPTDNPLPSTTKEARKAALEAGKNANDLRKISLMLAIAQDRDRQAAEAMEDIRSRRLRIEEDLTDAEDNPKSLTKKQRSDLETQYKSLQKKEKLAQKARLTANTFLLEVTQAVAAEPTKRAKFIGTYERKHGPVNDSKPAETLPTDTYATTEIGKPQTVASVEEVQPTTQTTPSVSPSVSIENGSEMLSETAVSEVKKKKERKPKKNESPRKVAEKEAKKKSKKAAKTSETSEIAANTEGSSAVPTERNQGTTEPSTENVTVSETAISGGASMDDVVKTDKKPSKNEGKAKKSDKKSKKQAVESPQVTLVNYRNYDRTNDVFMNSPAPECAIAFEGKDEFTGKSKRETSPTRFFTHTDDLMRKALGDKDFITCDITGTKVESSRYTYLNLTFTILSKDIQRTLGFLDRGTPIIFVLVNGTKVTLRANKTDIGVVDIDKGTTTYKAQLTAESITDITGSELDYVRVNWSSGYEDYEVFDVDVLKNLFNCLYKK